MKYPLFFGTFLALSLLGITFFFTLGFPQVPFLQETFSFIASLPHIYPLFVIFGALFGIGILIFTYFAFVSVRKNTRYVRTLLILAFLTGETMIMLPYNHVQPIFTLGHTILAFVLAFFIILLAKEFSTVEQPQEKILSWLQHHMSSLLGIGTIVLLLFSGINMLAESYFFFLTSIWFFIVGLTVKRVTSPQ